MSEPGFDSRAADGYLARVEVQAGEALAGRGQLAAARDRFEKAVRLQPRDAPLHYQLGLFEWRLGREQAGACFQRAVDLDPGFVRAHTAFAAWALQRGRTADADRASARAMELAPEDESVGQTRAAVLEAAGDMPAAWRLVEGLVRRGFVSMPLIRLYGRMARYHGDPEQALAVVEKRLTAGNLTASDRALLEFTAADLLDGLGCYDEAFEHARSANRLAAPAYRREGHERTIERFIAYFTRERLAAFARPRVRSEQPVFIVGMPRSGTSLVEQIVPSHPSVHGGGELDLTARMWTATVQALGNRVDDYPACLDRLTAETAGELAEVYLRPLSALEPTAVRITDKLPLNFLHLGLIAVLLPGARVIDCRRDPRDTCLSCFMAMFESGNDFKYDLGNTAHFYGLYRRLMEHWKRTVELPILEVSYEELVREPTRESRRLLDLLGLDWDERCLRFFETKRAVTSSSRQQVRRPLYQSSIGRWRRYERHLTEVDGWFGAPGGE